MPAVSLSPVFNGYQSFLASGLPNNAGFINTYVAGTNTPVATYTSSAGTIANAVSIPLNAAGFPPNEIWIVTGTAVKFTIIDSSSNVIGTYDNVTGVNDISSNISFVLKTSSTGSAEIPVGTTAQRDSPATGGYTRFNSSLNVQEYYNGTNWIPFDFLNTQRISVASAATVDLTVAAALVTRHIQITGNVTITAFTIPIGETFFVSFSDTPILTNNASIVTNTGSNIQVTAGDSCIIRSTAINVVEILSYSTVTSIGTSIQRGYIDGLVMSTAGSSATMTIAAGQASNSTNSVLMNLSSVIAKTTSAWAVGTAAGGLDTGAIANTTWYYFYLIRRPDTGVVDVVFSTSSSSPTLPANYTQYRYIGAGLTNGSAQWTAFTQAGDEFTWSSPVINYSAAGSATAQLLTCTVPLGRKMKVLLHANYATGGSGNGGFYFSDPSNTDLAPSVTASPLAQIAGYGSAAGFIAAGDACVWSNTSAQIRHREFGTQTSYIATVGWTDLRGRGA